MMTDDREVLSALMDGEVVDPDVLARVLDEPGNRGMLVDFARLRLASRTSVPGEAEWKAPALVGRGARPPLAWARAAAVVLLLGAGAGAGTWLERNTSRERAPEPARVVQFDPVSNRNE
jgi:hypothetical protein